MFNSCHGHLHKVVLWVISLMISLILQFCSIYNFIKSYRDVKEETYLYFHVSNTQLVVAEEII